MTTQSVSERIERELRDSRPLQTNELRQKCGNPPESTFFKYLKKAVEEGRVICRKERGRAWYVLMEDAWKLQSMVEDRTALEQHIIRNARLIMEQLMTCDLSDPKAANRAMSWRSGMLVQAVDRLRIARPDIPNLEDPVYEEYEGPNDSGKMNMTGWYRYWLDVLESLKAL